MYTSPKPHFHFWQIDAARGLAVIGMIFFHFLFDLRFYLGIPLSIDSGLPLLLGRITALAFISIVGISAGLKFQKQPSPTNFIKRSITILFWATAISFATYFLFPHEFVVFGILHLIGISLILLIPFLYVKNNFILLLSGLIIIVTGITLAQVETTSNSLFWLGLKSRQFVSLDYYPLLPWFGFIVFGLIFSRLYHFKKTPDELPFLTRLGRHSLVIYLVHQPIIIAALFLLKLL